MAFPSSNESASSFFSGDSLSGRELEVRPGEYELLKGTDKSIRIRTELAFVNLEQHNLLRDPYPGVRRRGFYAAPEGELPIVSFLYFKIDPNTGQPEARERAIILEGVGYGEHPGHAGQPPTWYLIGPQVGSADPTTGQVLYFPPDNTEIAAKHFSIACIVGGPLGVPLLANPHQ